MTEQRKTFSRESILAKQKAQKEAYEKKQTELRQMLRSVAQTDNGKEFLRYLFLLCGGDSSVLKRKRGNPQQGQMSVDTDETLLTIGTRLVWDSIRFNLDSDILKTIEKHTWET